MKAIRLVVCYGPNPAFDKDAAAIARANGEAYDVPADIKYEPGTINEHPDAWILCVMAKPLCAPADEACRVKVRKYLNHPARAKQMARLKQMATPQVYQQLPDSLKKFVDEVGPKWLSNPTDSVPETPSSHDVPPTETDASDLVDEETLSMFRTDDEVGLEEDIEVAD